MLTMTMLVSSLLPWYLQKVTQCCDPHALRLSRGLDNYIQDTHAEYLTCTKRMSCGLLMLHLAMVLAETLKAEKSAGGGML